MKGIKGIIFLLSSAAYLNLCSACENTPTGKSGNQSKTYEADKTSDFMNPERGWHTNIDFIGGGNWAGMRAAKNLTLARTYVRLDNYRDQPLPQSVLDAHTTRFQQVREAGIKLILRYSYNFGMNQPDAPVAIVLQHIEQLASLWQENADVIAVHQAGFVGAWGEWHSSTNNLTSDENVKAITSALLRAAHSSRMIQLRTPRRIRDLFPDPVTSGEAFANTGQARIGLKNDSFLRNYTDAGTYSQPPDYKYNQALKDYTIAISPHVVMGGETVEDVTWTEGNRQSCPDAVAEMELLNWDYLNRDYAQSVITPWFSGGCFDEITLRLGYRLRLIKAAIPSILQQGGDFNVSLELTNDAWGKVYNPRRLDIVFRRQNSSEEYRCIMLEDARKLLPGGGKTQTLQLTGKVPDMPAGNYSVFLHLADPFPSITHRPEYSIRLANKNIWEAWSGYNSLDMSVEVIR